MNSRQRKKKAIREAHWCNIECSKLEYENTLLTQALDNHRQTKRDLAQAQSERHQFDLSYKFYDYNKVLQETLGLCGSRGKVDMDNLMHILHNCFERTSVVKLGISTKVGDLELRNDIILVRPSLATKNPRLSSLEGQETIIGDSILQIMHEVTKQLLFN